MPYMRRSRSALILWFLLRRSRRLPRRLRLLCLVIFQIFYSNIMSYHLHLALRFVFFSFVNVYIIIGLFGLVRKTHLNKKKSYIQPTLHLICGIYFVIGIYFEGVKSTGFSIKNIKYINAKCILWCVMSWNLLFALGFV